MSDIDMPTQPAFHRRFRRCDLNLLIALDALLSEGGNVTRAAERLALSQSAMSHTLNRLRDVFQNELFVRAGSRMVPTPFVIQLRPALDAWMDSTSRLLASAERFDLRACRARLVISVPEQVERRVMPPLMAHLFNVAPEVEIFVTPFPLKEAIQALDDGKVEIAVAIGEVGFKPWHVVRRVCDTSFVQIYNPLLIGGARPLPLERIAALPHLKVSYEPARNIVIDSYLEARGLVRRIVAGCAGAASVPLLIGARPWAAILPSLVASSFPVTAELAIEPFGDDSLSVPVLVVWHRRSDADPAHCHVRERLAHYLQSTGPEAG